MEPQKGPNDLIGAPSGAPAGLMGSSHWPPIGAHKGPNGLSIGSSGRGAGQAPIGVPNWAPDRPLMGPHLGPNVGPMWVLTLIFTDEN